MSTTATALMELPKSELASKTASGLNRLKRMREESAAIGERAVSAVAVIGASYATGYAYGRGWADKDIPGTDVPLVLGGGAAALLVGISGFGGKMSDVLSALGSGVVGADMALRGSKAGAEAKAKAGK